MCVGNTSTNTRIRPLSTPCPCPVPVLFPCSTAICRRMQKDSSLASRSLCLCLNLQPPWLPLSFSLPSYLACLSCLLGFASLACLPVSLAARPSMAMSICLLNGSQHQQQWQQQQLSCWRQLHTHAHTPNRHTHTQHLPVMRSYFIAVWVIFQASRRKAALFWPALALALSFPLFLSLLHTHCGTALMHVHFKAIFTVFPSSSSFVRFLACIHWQRLAKRVSLFALLHVIFHLTSSTRPLLFEH